MIHDIVIWKLVLAGFALACFSFLVGFFIAVVCAASSGASRMEEEMEKDFLHPEFQPFDKKMRERFL